MVWIPAHGLIEHPCQGLIGYLKVRKNTLLIKTKPRVIWQWVPLLSSLSMLRAPSRLSIVGYE